MRIALVDCIDKCTYYPMGLLKIGAWRKSLGDTCKLFTNELPKAGEFDQIWISVTFSFDIPKSIAVIKEALKRVPVVVVGGVAVTLFPDAYKNSGVDVRPGRINDAEEFSPDQLLLPGPPEYSISRTSLGCIRKCGFCGVRRLEPEFSNRDWREDLWPGVKSVRFYDNNWLAKDKERLEWDIAILRGMVSANRITSIDFNQGIDCRLITEEIVSMIKGLPISPIRLAFDGMQEDKFFQDAVTLLSQNGFKLFHNYVLYNFMDTPQDCYYRIREHVRLHVELGVGVYAFMMRYQPLEDFGRKHVGKYWTIESLHGFQSCMNSHSATGMLSSHSLEEFGYWFGNTADEFVKLISYPKIHQLNEKKKSSLRWKRAYGEDGIYKLNS
jgi:hypothetical protein